MSDADEERMRDLVRTLENGLRLMPQLKKLEAAHVALRDWGEDCDPTGDFEVTITQRFPGRTNNVTTSIEADQDFAKRLAEVVHQEARKVRESLPKTTEADDG